MKIRTTNWIAEFKTEDSSEIDALMSAADYEASL
jgi:glycine cleavage system H lipoate-binding protein